ncbi:MAG: PilZ domain-containing protein [Candidatus Acidiferrales bacterium]
MASPAMRRSDRVSLTLLLEVSGKDSFGKEFNGSARTLLINRGGAVIVLDRELKAEEQVHLRRQAAHESHRESDARVVGQFGREKDGFLYGVELLDPSNDLWGIEFPPIAESEEAVARMLLECSYCRSREVVYLNELDLRGFETNRGIARHCKTCGVPSIWTQAPHEDEKKLAARARGRRGIDGNDELPEGGDKRGRTRIRLKTRLTACVRQAGADDELAVCEDISAIGMCFRSKRRYESQSKIQVAVPYSPDAANIFLPARVIYSEEMPKAGLFRHGTEYSKVGPRAH